MGTTIDDIREWLEEAKSEGATHLIVMTDSFSHEDYPVRVKPNEDVHTIYRDRNGSNMQRVMEVYAVHLDWEKQLNEIDPNTKRRKLAMNFDKPPAKPEPTKKMIAAPRSKVLKKKTAETKRTKKRS